MISAKTKRNASVFKQCDEIENEFLIKPSSISNTNKRNYEIIFKNDHCSPVC